MEDSTLEDLIAGKEQELINSIDAILHSGLNNRCKMLKIGAELRLYEAKIKETVQTFEVNWYSGAMPF